MNPGLKILLGKKLENATLEDVFNVVLLANESKKTFTNEYPEFVTGPWLFRRYTKKSTGENTYRQTIFNFKQKYNFPDFAKGKMYRTSDILEWEQTGNGKTALRHYQINE